MKITQAGPFDPAYIHVTDNLEPIVRTVQRQSELWIDLDEEGNVVGIEIMSLGYPLAQHEDTETH